MKVKREDIGPIFLAFPQPRATKPVEEFQTEKSNSSVHPRTIHISQAGSQTAVHWDAFKANSSLKIEDVLGKKGNKYFLQPTIYTIDKNFNVEALATLISFINQDDSKFAPHLNRIDKLNLVAKLINQTLKFPKQIEYSPVVLARKLIRSLSHAPYEFNSAELKVLENPQTRKVFIGYLLRTAADAQNNDFKPAFKIGMSSFSSLEEALTNIKKMSKKYQQQYNIAL